MYAQRIKSIRSIQYISTIQYTHNPAYALGLAEYKRKRAEENAVLKEKNNEREKIKDDEMNEELQLPEVTKFDILLKILFKYSRRDAAFQLIENIQKHSDKLTLNIFELCLFNDEDISWYN